MTNQPLVTVITATFNIIKLGRTDFFRQCLESVHNQTYPNIEHIIIDGASTDGSLDLIQEYVDKGWVKCFSEPDNGIYDAMNKGILKANGDYVICLNSDDFYCNENAIKMLVHKALETNADACYGSAIRVKPDTLEFMAEWNGKKSFKPVFNMFPCHQTFLIKTSVMKELGLYCTEYKVSSDNIFFTKMINYNKVFAGIDDTIITFRDGGYSNDNFAVSKKDRITGFYKEYGQYHNLDIKDIEHLLSRDFIKLPLKEAIELGSKLVYTNNPDWVYDYFNYLFRRKPSISKKPVKKVYVNEINTKSAIKYLLSRIFSIKNVYRENAKHKVITILWLSLKIKQKM